MSAMRNDNVVLFYRRANDKKRKVTHDDVTVAQYEVLQLQKEKIKEQIRFFKLQNLKLERELQID